MGDEPPSSAGRDHLGRVGPELGDAFFGAAEPEGVPVMWILPAVSWKKVWSFRPHSPGRRIVFAEPFLNASSAIIGRGGLPAGPSRSDRAGCFCPDSTGSIPVGAAARTSRSMILSRKLKGDGVIRSLEEAPARSDVLEKSEPGGYDGYFHECTPRLAEMAAGQEFNS